MDIFNLNQWSQTKMVFRKEISGTIKWEKDSRWRYTWTYRTIREEVLTYKLTIWSETKVDRSQYTTHKPIENDKSHILGREWLSHLSSSDFGPNLKGQRNVQNIKKKKTTLWHVKHVI